MRQDCSSPDFCCRNMGQDSGQTGGLTLSELSPAVTGNRRKVMALQPLPVRGLPLCFGCKSGVSSPSEPAVTRCTSHWPHWSMGCTLEHPTPRGVPGDSPAPQGPVSSPGMGGFEQDPHLCTLSSLWYKLLLTQQPFVNRLSKISRQTTKPLKIPE